MRKGKLKRRDIVLTTRGTVGSVAFYSSTIPYEHMRINSGMVIMRCGGGLDTSFIYQLLKSPFIKEQYRLFSSGSAQPQLPIKDLKRIPLVLPPFPIQQKIAALLSAYDDLIENNNKRIALLEKAAEEIYREWFVRMRFPGWQQVKFEKGIPVNWAVTSLGKIIELAYGKSLKEEVREEGRFAVYGSSGIVGTHTKALVKGPGIIVGRKGSVGSIHWSDEDFFPIDTVYYVKSELSLKYLYYLLHSMNFINNDAAVPGLNRNQAYSNKFYLPPIDLINSFDQLIQVFFDQRRVLADKNEKLSKSREILLSRLISGKLPVDSLDIRFPPSMIDEGVTVPA